MTTYYKGCSVKSATCGASNGGTPFIAIVFNVPMDDGDKARTVYMYLSDGAYPHSKKKLDRIGFNGSFEKPEFSAGDDVELAMRTEEYEGKEREKWDIAPGKGYFEVKPLDKDKARALAARWKASSPSSAPARPAAAPSKAPPAKSSAPSKPKKAASKATDKDSAWEEYVAQIPTKKPDEVADKFYESIEKVAKEVGRKEDEFTEDDWKAVSDDALPF